ncbi:MAG: hypothetical protein HYW77_01430 [Parcubacteria group bacterium]|nr:hypothetical protein [Parcubacteria group bacterium]
MTKNFLSPIAREILIGPKSDTTFFEVFHYPFDKNPELGHLFVVAQVLTDDEALSYVPNLLASFLKREYFETAGDDPDPQTQFERALKKANELTFDLAENNNVKLNMAITVLAGDKLMTSRVGRAKLLLAREGNTTDVFSNVDLFGKTTTGEREFSNIISGKIQESDKLLFFIPNRRLSARENSLKASLVKMGQEEFFEYIKNLNQPEEDATKSPLTCCAIHINLSKEEKEIIPAPDQPQVLLTKEEKKEPPTIMDLATPNPAEISRIPKKDLFKKLGASLARTMPFSTKKLRIPGKRTLMGLGILIVIIVFFSVRGLISSQQKKADLKKATAKIEEIVKLSESEIALGNNKKAREYLGQALTAAFGINDGEEKINLINSVQEKVVATEFFDSKKPELIAELPEPISEGLTLSNEDGTFMLGLDGLIKKLDSTSQKFNDLLKINLENPIKISAIYDKLLYFYDGQKLFWKVSPAQKTISSLTITSNEIPRDMRFYQENVYILTSTISKVSDVTKGQTQQQKWLKNEGEFDAVSFTVDQNIFVLTKDGRLLRYFKGDKIDDRPVDFSYSNNSVLYPIGADFILVDREQKKARLMNSTGILQRTWDLSDTGEILNTYFDPLTKNIYILSKEKLWKLTIEI